MMRHYLQNLKSKSPIPSRNWLNKALLPIAFCLLAFGSNAQTCDLTIQKTGPNSIVHSAPMSYTITIANNGPSAVTGATFTDNLPAFVGNVALGSCTPSGGASCGTQSVSNSSFSGTVDLPVNGQVVFVLNMDAPSTSYSGSSFSNTITVAPPSGTTEIDNSTNSSTWNTSLSGGGGGGGGTADIGVTKSNSPTTSFNNSNMPGTINYTITWTNNSANAVSNVNLIDVINGQNEVYTGSGSGYVYYDGQPTNLVWTTTSGATSTPSGTFDNVNSGLISGAKTLNATVANWAAGESITLTYTLNVSYSLSGCGRDMTYEINNSASFSNVTDPNSSNDNASVINQFSVTGNPCNNTDIVVSTTNSPTTNLGSCSNLPATINYSITWKNNGPAAANGSSIYTDMVRFPTNVTGTGNATYSYPYSISNVVWSASGTSSVPTNIGFSNYSGGGSGSGNSGTINVSESYNNSQFAYLQTFVNTWNPGDEITLTYSMTINAPTINGCGRDISFIVRSNPILQSIGGTVNDIQPSNNSANIDNEINCTSTLCVDYDLESYIKHDFVTTCEVPATIRDTVYFINNSSIPVTDVTRSHQIDILGASLTGSGNAQFAFNWNITDVYTQLNQSAPYSSLWAFNNTSGTIDNSASFQYQTYMAYATQNGISLDPGDTLKLIYTLNISAPTVTGCNRTLNLPIHYSSSIGSGMPNSADIVPSNDNKNITNAISGSSVDLSVSKSVSSAITQHNNTLGMTLYFANASNGSTMPEAIWRDTLPGVFTLDINSIQCVASGGATCSPVQYDSVTRILTQTVYNMPSGGDVTITYNGIVNSPLTKTYTTKAYASSGCGADCVPATNFTQTNFQINGDKNSIGNYVWKDADGDGIQDSGEPSLQGVTVGLYSSSDVLISTATTDNNGNYSFASVTGTSTASSIFNLNITPGTSYKIKVTNMGSHSSVTGLGLNNITIAPGETSGTNSGTTATNNDAFISSGFPTILITLGALGTNNETYDFGFHIPNCPTPNCGTATSIKN